MVSSGILGFCDSANQSGEAVMVLIDQYVHDGPLGPRSHSWLELT